MQEEATWSQPFGSLAGAVSAARAVSTMIQIGLCVSEPLGPDERREEVDNDGDGHRNSDVGHRSGSSDFFAGEDERVANAHADQPERKQRRQPNDQIHRSLLPSGTTFKGRAEAAGK